MPRPVKLLALVPLGAAIVSVGCISADTGFDQVQRVTGERTGYDLAWTRGAEDDRRVQAYVADRLEGPLSMTDAVQVALLSNRDLQATYEHLGIRRGELIQASLPQNPVFGNETRIFSGETVAEGVIVQDLISVFTIPLRRGIAGNRLEAAQRQVAMAAVHLIGDVKRAYIDYLAARQEVELLEQVVIATRGSYLTSLKLREAGNAKQLDVLQQRTLYEKSKVLLNAAVERMAMSRERLNTVMGLWGDQLAWETPAPGRLPGMPGASYQAARAVTLPGEEEEAVAASPAAPKAMAADGLPGQLGEGVPGEPLAEYHAERLAGGPTNAQIADETLTVLGELEAGTGPETQAVKADPTTNPRVQRFAEVERMAVERSLALSSQWQLIEAQADRYQYEQIVAALPFLNLGLAYEHVPDSEVWGFGPGGVIPIPLWDRGQGQETTESARLRQRVEHYAQTATTIRAAARSLQARLMTTRSRAAYYRDVVLPLEAALVAEAQLQYNAMTLGPLELLVAKRQQIESGLAYILALHAYWHARADLEQLLDGGMPPSAPTRAAMHDVGIID